MNKKLISILLAIALVAGLLPATALAADSTDTGVYIAGKPLAVNTAYYNKDFWPLLEPAPEVDPSADPSIDPSIDPSAQPTEQPAGSVDSASAYAMTRTGIPDCNAYLTGDAANGYTLTIKDLSVMGVKNRSGNAAIYSEHDLTIVLEGVNSAIGADDDYRSAGILVDGDLTIKDSGTLTATGGNSSASISQGICADIVTVTDGATVIATGGTARYSSYGIYGVAVSITEGSTVVATGGTATYSYGIYRDNTYNDGAVTITDATAIVTGGNVSDRGWSYGIYSHGLVTTITSSTVVARAGTVGGEFSGDRKAIVGSVDPTDVKLVGAVQNGAAQDTPDLETATSLAVVPDSWHNALPEADTGSTDKTYNVTNDTYIVSVDAVALELDTDTTINVAADKTLLTVSLSEDSGDTAGIRSTASVTLNGNIIAVSGLSTVVQGFAPCSGFEALSNGDKTVTIDGTLLAVGAGTPSGYGTGYSSAVDTTVNGTLIGVGVSGAQTYGINMPNTENGSTNLTVNNGGTVLGYAGPASPASSANDEITPIADGIHVTGTLSASGSVTGVGVTHGLSGTESVNGGAYLGKTAAVNSVVLADGCDFYDADGEVPEDLAAEQYITVGVKKYTATFLGYSWEREVEGIPHGGTVQGRFEELVPGERIEEAFVDSRDGYTFLGWYTSVDEGATLSDVSYDFDSEVTGDVNLYPKWRINTPPIIVQPTDEPTTEPTDEPTTEPSTEPTDEPTTEPSTEPTPCPQDETCPIAKFNDSDPKAWYHDGVHYCIEHGLMIGTSETEFEPHSPTSRAMIAVILHRLEGTPVNGQGKSGTFIDVEDYMWYTEAIEWAAANGIVLGHGDGTYAPLDPLTREQAAAILYRYVQYLGGGFTGAWAFRLDFSDLAEMGDWAYEGISWCVMNGILEGDDDGLLRPGDSIERCEMAMMIYRLCKILAE